MKKPKKRRRGRPPKNRPKIQVEWESIGNEEEIKEALSQAFELILSEALCEGKRPTKEPDDPRFIQDSLF